MQVSEDEKFSIELDGGYAMMQEDMPLEREKGVERVKRALEGFSGNRGM